MYGIHSLVKKTFNFQEMCFFLMFCGININFPIDLSDIRKSYSLIMHDLNNLSSWSKATGLLFNFNKCIVLHYGNNNPNFEYTLCNHVLSFAA